MYPFPATNPTDRTARVRGRIVLAVFVVLFTVIVGRLVQLQIVQHRYWLERARATQERTIALPPQRGTITDRNGTVLAIDVKAMAIAVDGINITHADAAVDILHDELSMSRTDLEAKVYRDAYFTWIDRGVDFDTAQRIRDRANEAGIYGLIFIDTWKRSYPQGRLASNVIGFVGMDGAGLEGIELADDDQLQGTAEVVQVLEGADGRTYDFEVLEPGSKGQDLTLTIDAGLQFICEEEIKAGVSRFRAVKGMVVVIDPRTCQVLAMAQDKGYDLNQVSSSTAESRQNLAATYIFEPGSIFKVFAGLASLDHGVVTPSDTFDGKDGISIAGHIMHNADNETFGTVTFAQIIEHSINTGMIQVVQRLGAEVLQAFLSSLGFGQRTGIGLPGEEVGILRPASEWSDLDLAAASIGQSVAVTGIQLARAMTVVATEGILRKPSIVLTDASLDPGVRVCSAETADTMLNLMRAVVESGTGTPAAIDGFSIAGKTGTAQKAVPGQGYVEGKYTSLFAGVITADSPGYIMLVVLDEVRSGPVAGGYTAGQIFHNAATRLIAYERIVPF